mmetsp:Transcript_12461/g.15612  ORF Transcript_12461/g.15612 Transcript_12461/m.15612 type:complete len:190 (-) Transcript_12461:34-603(-)|eukprot:CAMPEP_0172497752 /NCGR_PEP_ID=MMETSP1066-20121228/104559_1 /TAXON_ID=671091 /ORGANISM="Coscinodiscus wailesii, Strain CCMP2513" /LENGTH=189 /DNA_ID=CAMNT_0013270697 /DNA_START=77 /DNA_END=646 /DNA_ORIENTATION=+
MMLIRVGLLSTLTNVAIAFMTTTTPRLVFLSSSLRTSNSVARCCQRTKLFATLDELEITDTLEGTGDKASFGDIVTVKYEGRLLSESSSSQEVTTPFDTSMISFKLGYGKVLEGCDKGIVGMRVGGKRNLLVPSQLGFGPQGFSGPSYSVPPDADLEYGIELIAVSNGPMAESMAKLGMGLHPETVYLK